MQTYILAYKSRYKQKGYNRNILERIGEKKN